MFNETYDINNYINFLYYGSDSDTIFDKSEFASIYKNKYERLSKTLPDDNNAQPISVANAIFSRFIENIEAYIGFPIIDYLNKDKISLIKQYFSFLQYDRLIFNSYISLSIIELYTDDEDLWDSIKVTISSICNDSYYSIHDDSKGKYRILTLDIPIIDYKYSNNIPDIRDYNYNIINSYYILKDKTPKVDDSIKNIFTSELKSFINNDRIIEEGLFSDLLKKSINIDIKNTSLEEIQSICSEISSYLNDENIYLVSHLQFRILQNIFKGSFFDKDFEDTSIVKLLITLFSIDIFIYNEINLDKKDSITRLFSTYNYYIIRLQDMIDNIDNNLNNKKIALFMYKNQLSKSRNKLQERMK